MNEVCEHLEQAKYLEPTATVCQECVDIGSGWVHLRQCLVCGHVGCCDSSPNRHATAHWNASAHPVIRSLETDENWGYCYVDDLFIERIST
jgi:uncharacterized UBP type Zn finger protein